MEYTDKIDENDDWMDNTSHIKAISEIIGNLEKQLKGAKTNKKKLKLINLILKFQKLLNRLFRAQVEYIEYKKDSTGSFSKLREELERGGYL